MCGVVGISSNESVAADIYDALTMLQHRGQDAAGIMTCHKGQFLQRKGEGLVRDVFQAKFADLQIGQTGRYRYVPVNVRIVIFLVTLRIKSVKTV